MPDTCFTANLCKTLTGILEQAMTNLTSIINFSPLLTSHNPECVTQENGS